MSIESPETYGEEYWASQLAANLSFEEEIEKSVKDFIPNIFSDTEIRESIPFGILPKLEGLLAFPHPGLGAIGGRFVSEIADQAVGMIMTPALRKTQYAANRLFQNMLMGPDTASTLFSRKKINQDMFDYRFRASGYNAIEQHFLHQAGRPFPSLPEMFRWARYHGDPDNIWSTLFEVVDIDPTDYVKWDWLLRPQLTTDQITALFKRGKLTDVLADSELGQLGWTKDQQPTIRDMSFVIPNAMLCLQGNLHQKAGQDTVFADFTAADIHPDYHQKYLDAVLTKPASADIIAFELRQENQLSGLGESLQQIGIHPDYLEIYQTLADRIPPLPDIITMAVREAFSPEIARRFGQYEDFPADFGRYAGMQGLSEEWAKRYWASHWGLPSVTQGFEMLHRGIIDKTELGMLLKAQDVMPFWRDKLIAMAYTPFTRVDVRRMYKEGVLDEKGVYNSYLDLGYEPDNAERMTDFVVKQTLSALSKFTSTDIVGAYTKRMIDRSEARSLLRELGIRSTDVTYIITTADYKREWKLTDQKIKATRNLYKKGELNETTAQNELLRLNLPSDQVNVLMEQWWFEKREIGVKTYSKAEVAKFMKAGIITEVQARQEYASMGYDTEHVDTYIRAIAWQQSQN